MRVAKTLSSACNFSVNYIYIFGGWSEELKSELDIIERYNIKDNVFEEITYKMH